MNYLTRGRVQKSAVAPKVRFAAARIPLLLILFMCAAFLGAGGVDGASLTVSWVDNSNGVAATRLERRLETTAFAAIADAPPGVTQYVDTSISAGTGYCYRVLAYSGDEVSPYSEEVCAVVSDQRPQLDLTVTNAGDGIGTVTSTPWGILCGTDCSQAFPTGTSVTLIAVPAVGSTFAGWSGPGCDGLEPCTLAGQGPVTVTATFVANFFIESFFFHGSPFPGPHPPEPLFNVSPFFPWIGGH